MPVSESRVCVIRYNAICADLFCFFQDSALFTLHSDLCARSARARRGSRARPGAAARVGAGSWQAPGPAGGRTTRTHTHTADTRQKPERERQRVAECAARDRVSVPSVAPVQRGAVCARALGFSHNTCADEREREREREKEGCGHRDSGLYKNTTTVHRAISSQCFQVASAGREKADITDNCPYAWAWGRRQRIGQVTVDASRTCSAVAHVSKKFTRPPAGAASAAGQSASCR